MDEHDIRLVNSCPGCARTNQPTNVVYYENGKFWLQDFRGIPVEYKPTYPHINTTTLGDKEYDDTR